MAPRTPRPTRSAVRIAASSCAAVICCSWRLRCTSAAPGTKRRSDACDMSSPLPVNTSSSFSKGSINTLMKRSRQMMTSPASDSYSSREWQVALN